MEDSLKRRYMLKLFSAIVVAGMNIWIQGILPRAFSVKEYANYTYNLNVFSSVLAISMLSMDGAFSSKISKRPQEGKLVIFYGKFLFFIITLLNIFIFAIFLGGVADEFFVGQTQGSVVLALNSALTLKLLQEVTSLFDCYAMTRVSEPFVILQRIIIGASVYIVYACKMLNLKSFYMIQIITVIVLVTILLMYFIKHNRYIFQIYEGTQSTKQYIPEFVSYCRPLVIAGIVSNGLMIFSNWLLKKFGGDTEQAFFGAAWQLNTLVAYTFTPLIALLQREYAIRVKEKKNLRELYQKILEETIALVCFVSCFIMVNADYTLGIFLGEKYVGAAAITKMIMFYTIFQAWGQVNGTLFSATERTKVYANITVINQVCAVVLISIFQIPNFLFPMGLGAVGIGLQKAIGNLISVMLCVGVNCRYLQISFWSECRKAFVPIVSCTFIAWLVRVGCKVLLNMWVLRTKYIIQFFVSGCIYSIIIFIILFYWPQMLGVDENTLNLRKIVQSRTHKK